MQGPPTSFGYPLFVRALVPGLLFLCGMMPLLGDMLVGALQAWGASFAEIIAVLLLIAFFLGFLLSLLDRGIYVFYEGRRFWPKWIRRKLTKRLQRKVDELVNRAEKVKQIDPPLYDEIWFSIRAFPVARVEGRRSVGRPIVVCPSRLGNLMESYEQYSFDRYGMDGVFYWYRLRMLLDKEAKREIDNSGAEADAVVYSSFGLLISSFAYFGVGMFQLLLGLLNLSIESPVIIEQIPQLWLTIGLVLLLLAYAVYRLSIPLHRTYGEYFKSMFDLGKEKLKKELVVDMSDDSRDSEHWQNLYYWLTYLEPPQGNQ